MTTVFVVCFDSNKFSLPAKLRQLPITHIHMVRITQPYYRQTRIQDSLHSADKISLTARRLFLLCSWFFFTCLFRTIFECVRQHTFWLHWKQSPHLHCMKICYCFCFTLELNRNFTKKIIWTWRLHSFKRSIFSTYILCFFFLKKKSVMNQYIEFKDKLKMEYTAK